MKDLPGWAMGLLLAYSTAVTGFYLDAQTEIKEKDKEIRECEKKCSDEKIEALQQKEAETKAFLNTTMIKQDSMIKILERMK